MDEESVYSKHSASSFVDIIIACRFAMTASGSLGLDKPRPGVWRAISEFVAWLLRRWPWI